MTTEDEPSVIVRHVERIEESSLKPKEKDTSSSKIDNIKLFIIGEYIKRKFYIDCLADCEDIYNPSQASDSIDKLDKETRKLSQSEIIDIIKEKFINCFSTSSFETIYDCRYDNIFDFSNVYDFITEFIKHQIKNITRFLEQLPERSKLFDKISYISYSDKELSYIESLKKDRYKLEMYIYKCAYCRIYECDPSGFFTNNMEAAIFCFYYEDSFRRNIAEDNFFFVIFKNIIDKYSMYFCDLSNFNKKNDDVTKYEYIHSHIPKYFTSSFKKAEITEDDYSFSKYGLLPIWDVNSILVKNKNVKNIAEIMNVKNRSEDTYLKKCICGIAIWDYIYFRKSYNSARKIFIKISDKATIDGIKTNITVVGLPKKPKELDDDASGLSEKDKKKLRDNYTNAKIKCCKRLYEEADKNIREYSFLQDGST